LTSESLRILHFVQHDDYLEKLLNIVFIEKRMIKLLVATHNRGKLVEFAELLVGLDVEWLSLDDVGITADVEETGRTFLENAILKAQHYAAEAGLLTLADDSGLLVDELNGAPGVQTARYGGPGLTMTERFQRVLVEMADVPWEQRAARFHCALALAGPDGTLIGTAEGVCEGKIAWEAAGDQGFGYDPIFYLPDYGLTMGQFPSGEKHRISHRGRALQAMAPLLRRVIAQESEHKE
jgi:XTP/dITP diphosphohydrolase